MTSDTETEDAGSESRFRKYLNWGLGWQRFERQTGGERHLILGKIDVA